MKKPFWIQKLVAYVWSKQASTASPNNDNITSIENDINAIPESDLILLEVCARKLIYFLGHKASITSPGDLLNEAIIRTIAGTRTWKKSEVSLTMHLTWVMISIYDELKKKNHYEIYRTLPSPLKRGDEVELVDPLDNATSTAPTPDQVIDARKMLDQIKQYFGEKNDQEVLKLIDVLQNNGFHAEDNFGPSIQDELKLSKRKYQTLMEKLRYGARKVKNKINKPYVSDGVEKAEVKND